MAETAEQLASEFPAAAEDPITVVLPGYDATPVSQDELDEYAALLSSVPGVATVRPPPAATSTGKRLVPPASKPTV